MTKKRKFRIEFAKKDRVTEAAYQLVADLFDVKDALITNESTFNDFLSPIDLPGHNTIPISKVPKSKRSQYGTPPLVASNLDRYFVTYPPLTTMESETIMKIARKLILSSIEKIYGISLQDYPKKEPLYIWKVAKLLVANLGPNSRKLAK